MIAFILERLAFFAAIGGAGYIAYKGFSRIYKNIMLGRSEKIPMNVKAMILVALGQQKMFKRPIAALLHITIYVSFVITQIELIEIMVDGAFGTHRWVYHVLEQFGAQGFYTFVINFIEVLSLLTFF